MDLKQTKVENKWILFSLCLGLFWRISREGIVGIPGFAAGTVVPVIILGGLFYFHMLGSGDIKVFCALGGIMGVADVFRCVCYSFLIGAMISLALLISCGNFCRRIQYLIKYFYDYFVTGRVKAYRQKGLSLENFHFTIPIFMSVMLYAGGIY